MKKIYSRLIFTLLFLISTSAIVNGQAALLVLIFGDKIATEKFHLSIDAGINISSMPGLKTGKYNTGLYFGLGTFIKINDKWALTPEFKPISTRGAKSVLPLRDYSAALTNINYDFVLNYIDVPVIAQYKLNKKVFIGAGPQLSFLTSAKQVSTGTLPLGSKVDIEEKMNENFKPVYFSVPLEIGYSLSDFRKGKGMDIKFRYNIGASEMINANKYGSTTGTTFQLFLSFPFVK
jgi:hypothetical protein